MTTVVTEEARVDEAAAGEEQDEVADAAAVAAQHQREQYQPW